MTGLWPPPIVRQYLLGDLPGDRRCFGLTALSSRRQHRDVAGVAVGRGDVANLKPDRLLGAVTLETLGLMLNPLTREILPMQMTL